MKPDDGDGFGTVEILKAFVTFRVDHHAGETLRVPTYIAEKWVKEGKAKYIGPHIRQGSD